MSFLEYADQLIAQLNPVQGTYNDYSIGINRSIPKTTYGLFKTAKTILNPKKAAFGDYLRLRGGKTPNYAKYIKYQKDKFASSSHRTNTSRRHNPITGTSTMPLRIGYTTGTKRRAPMSARTRGRNLRQRIRTAQRGFQRTAGYYGLQPGERKFFDVTDTAGTIAATGAIAEDSLNHIAQGVGEQQRVGRVAWIQSLHVRGILLLASVTSAATGGRDVVRIIWYLDRQCNGATATVAQILESTDINSHLNLENSSRFHILKEILMPIVPVAGGGDVGGANCNWEGTEIPFKFNLKFKKPIKVEFNGATGVIAEIRSNNIGLMVISRGGTSGLSLETCNRIRFTD